MKKNSVLSLLVIILFCTNNAVAQNAYYDAIQLRRHINKDGDLDGAKDSVYFILDAYIQPAKKNTPLEIDSILRLHPNPFFLVSGTARSENVFGNFVQSTISAASNLDVTNLADGLARFLIKRGKQELSIAFFQRMKDFLDSNIEARTLFPATSKFLGNILAFQYSEFLQALREAFYKDVSNLIINLNLLIDLPKYQQLLKALPEIRLAIRSAKIVSELSQPDSSLHPANLISRFACLSEWGEMNLNLASSWKVLDKISESVRRMDTVQTTEEKTTTLASDFFITKTTALTETIARLDSTKIAKGTTLVMKSFRTSLKSSKDIAWIKFSDFQQNILNDSITLKIYLGLLYERMDSIRFRYALSRDTSVQQFMSDNRDNILRIADLVENFLVLANDVEKSIEDIRSKKDKGFTNDDYYTYIQKAIDVVDYGFKVANTIKEGIADDRYIVMARNAADLYKNIYTKNYNAAVMNAYLVLQEVLSKSKEAMQDKEATLRSARPVNAAEAASFAGAQTAVNNQGLLNKDSIDNRSSLVERILKYGNVIAGIVKAESAEEAEAAIEAAVLPAGSSSIKKNTDWNISLNAYIGGYFARSVNSTDKIDGSNSAAGVTAPVGVAFSKGLGHYKNGASIGSLSLYGTLIDVGAVAGYRLSNDSSALEQKVTLGDIFTPGGYLVYGIGLPFKWLSYVPLSVGYGWQYGSKLYLRKTDGKLTVSDKSRWRSNWFIGIDIPLTNFWTKQYKKKAGAN